MSIPSRRYNRADGTQRWTSRGRRTDFIQAVPVVAIALISAMYYATRRYCYAPHLLIGLTGGTEPRRYIASEAMEILDFLLVGLIAGILADCERNQKDSLPRTTMQLNAVYQELRQNFERMKRSERLYAIGQLSAGLAHEVRNPLASIGGAAAILRKKPGSEERRQEFLEIIKRSASA